MSQSKQIQIDAEKKLSKYKQKTFAGIWNRAKQK